jgi:hypothetical protein
VTKQVHDFEPGIERSGLFWTIPISPAALDADPHAGRARMHADELKVPDYHDFLNAVSPHPKKEPGRASFDVRWAGGGDRTPVRDETFGFRGAYIGGDATIEFAVKEVKSGDNGQGGDASDGGKVGIVYTSDPDGQNTVSAGVGTERNGVFF